MRPDLQYQRYLRDLHAPEPAPDSDSLPRVPLYNHIQPYTTPAHHPSSRPEDQASPPNMGSSGVFAKVRAQPLSKSVTDSPIPLSKPPETTHQTPRPKSPTHLPS